MEDITDVWTPGLESEYQYARTLEENNELSDSELWETIIQRRR